MCVSVCPKRVLAGCTARRVHVCRESKHSRRAGALGRLAAHTCTAQLATTYLRALALSAAISLSPACQPRAQNAERLDSEIVYDRDFDYDYFGFKASHGRFFFAAARLLR